MKQNTRSWLKGLAAAFVSGGAAAVAGGTTVGYIDPEHFNFHKGLAHMVEVTAVLFVAKGAIGCFLYLSQSPFPPSNPPQS